jgi:hypothetical protein
MRFLVPSRLSFSLVGTSEYICYPSSCNILEVITETTLALERQKNTAYIPPTLVKASISCSVSPDLLLCVPHCSASNIALHQARPMNSTTDIVGWAPEPRGRGTIGLLWSCFATLFLGTWTAIHPNLPGLKQKKISIFWRRIEYVVFCLVAPELTAFNATEAFGTAQQTRKELKAIVSIMLRKILNLTSLSMRST